VWPDLRPIETAGRVSCVFWKVGGVFDYSVVDEVVDAIAKDVSPRKMIIFGSAARYEAGDDSDIGCWSSWTRTRRGSGARRR
jgi:hypothetical protein